MKAKWKTQAIVLVLAIFILGLFSNFTAWAYIPPPSSVNAGMENTSAISISIDWNYVSGYSTYEIWRATGVGNNNYNLIHTAENVAYGQAKYIDSDVEPGTEYCYKVKTCASKSGPCSDFSIDFDCADTPDLPPPTTYTISGKVALANGTGEQDITVTYEGQQVYTDASGNYKIENALALDGYIRPAKTGYTFRNEHEIICPF
ncbi:hypothetical protein [Desulfonema magnum]|uniref:Fibronectin type III domain-containing protein n=1 Tax=Desulfonema magnum TaxID=45655 RepID=A0A975BHL0_9BACT|nr:hypothetical protein [Desulfonema magnum]QTA85415.1 fibronectin type III domain-containing protein [Desulfonema magnum]